MAKFRKIGVLTSGGDAPGMNACVKAVVHRAKELGIEVIGINGGYSGLINGDLVELSASKVANIIDMGGTILYTSRCPEFKTEAGLQTAVATCRANHIDALICIGGDGTFRGATDMTFHGIPSIGIPGTIDNDITATDYTIGLDTAINTAIELIDRLHDTSESHSRVSVVELMGNECGQIALFAAIAAGAVACAIPEIPFDEDAAIKRIFNLRAEGKRSMVVVVAEGVKTEDGKPYSEAFYRKLVSTGLDVKYFRAAHTVRGGRPTVRDRATAVRMANRAVECLVNGESDLVVCENDSKIVTVDIAFALIADRMYKNKLKDGDLDRFTPQQIEDMMSICEKRRSEIAALYDAAEHIAQ
ncbi:MAG: ATP-dependent 6-phosphofructokinase [Clostridia bacterium]|nr:ATP-dependent 6-phosphofructokinase [Clostridia bacterium]